MAKFWEVTGVFPTSVRLQPLAALAHALERAGEIDALLLRRRGRLRRARLGTRLRHFDLDDVDRDCHRLVLIEPEQVLPVRLCADVGAQSDAGAHLRAAADAETRPGARGEIRADAARGEGGGVQPRRRRRTGAA